MTEENWDQRLRQQAARHGALHPPRGAADARAQMGPHRQHLRRRGLDAAARRHRHRHQQRGGAEPDRGARQRARPRTASWSTPSCRPRCAPTATTRTSATPMAKTGQSEAEVLKPRVAKIPLGRMGTAEEIAAWPYSWRRSARASSPAAPGRSMAACRHGCKLRREALRRGRGMGSCCANEALMLRKLLAFVAGAAAALTISSAAPAAEYPTHPVTIVVAFTPGGPSDVLARIVGKRLQRNPAPAVHHREPARRRRQHRRRAGRACGARRLHAADGQQQHPRHQRRALQEARLRSGEGFRPDLADRHPGQHPGGQSQRAGELDGRADRARQGAARAS